MNTSKRPLSVWIISCVYLAVGCIGFVAHFRSLWQPDGIWIELTEFLAIVAGAFMLLGKNWARWLALAWMAFHVILSIFHPLHELIIHTVIFALIAWLLFRPDARQYFHGAKAQ